MDRSAAHDMVGSAVMTTGQIILTVFLAAGGYLLGAVPFALLVARGLYGVDIREIGTGNIGAGNARRELGFGAGALVMACDMAKGFAPALAAVLLLPSWPTALVAFMPVLGHQYSVFLRGSGGKGIATTAGAVLPLSPIVFGITMVAWVVVVSFRRSRRAGPYVAGGTYLVSSFLVPQPAAYRVLAVAICVSVLVAFRTGRGSRERDSDKESTPAPGGGAPPTPPRAALARERDKDAKRRDLPRD
jgi:acyl phosphate:glycerol-3-phosphate acyltransferase